MLQTENIKRILDEHDLLDYIQDGDAICCCFTDFENLHESPAGFGPTEQEAFDALYEDADAKDRIYSLLREHRAL